MFKYRNIEAHAYQSDICLQQRRRYGKGKLYSRAAAYFGFLILCCISFQGYSQNKRIIKKHEIRDGISPKSIVSSGDGLFAAQNMMYRHTVTVYDAEGRCQAKIRDAVNLHDFGHTDYTDQNYLGGPVEAAFTADGQYLWVSNYSMIGEGFEHPGCDGCHGSEYDPGFLYKINTSNFEIENVVKVGSVPKFLTISADGKQLLVSNWSSGDVSVVDLTTEEEVKRIAVGAHPRGIDITKDSKTAFVTVMGSTKVAEIDLTTYAVSYIEDLGRSPRHLILGNHDSTLFISMNSGSNVLRYNRFTKERKSCKTSAGPRSMCMTPEGDYLYVVNYFDHSFSKINTRDMEVTERVKTAEKPIGICGNWDDSEIWVACYSGSIEIFKDFHLDSLHHGTSMLGFDLSSFWAFGKSEVRTSDSVLVDELKSDEELVNGEDNQLNEPLEVVIETGARRVFDPKLPLDPLPKNRFIYPIVTSGTCNYHVIAGSFSSPENANNRKEELISKGYSAVVIVGTLNYVSASCHDNRALAEESAAQVKSNTGYSAWILKK